MLPKILRFHHRIMMLLQLRARTLYYSQLLGSFGHHSRIFGKIYVDRPENIFIGSDCTINLGVQLSARAPIRIGNYVRISSHVVIHTGYLDLSNLELPLRHLQKEVIIGDGVWIASKSLITAGVTIGENSVIAAGSVVVKDVPPMTLVGGVPADYIKSL